MSRSARRFGYLVASAINLTMLYLVTGSPGWQVVPFLTDDFTQVVGLVGASLTAGFVANLLYAVYDGRGFRAFGDVVTTSIGLAAVVRLWQVFPFSFGASSVDWEMVTRIVLVFGIAGSAIAIVLAVLRLLGTPPRREQP